VPFTSWRVLEWAGRRQGYVDGALATSQHEGRGLMTTNALCGVAVVSMRTFERMWL
jgi:hypothetical protein